jgi:drug/metabolite transporter (DMT)-like permease
VGSLDANLVGESAAMLTSCLWTVGSIFFTSAGRRIGSFSVNAYRIILAVGLLVAAHVVLLGTILPAATSAQWFWMGISGIVGLGIGDCGLFAAYVTIGPKRTTLIMALSPIFASVGAYMMLGETLSMLSVIGMAITLGGIVIVLSGRQDSLENGLALRKQTIWGLVFALVGAMGQGIGVVLSKKGLDVNTNIQMNPLSAALIRVILGTMFIWALALFSKKLPDLQKAARDKQGIKYAAAGAIVGPFAGMTLSMVAVANTETGIAQTLMSLMPVIIIPLVWIIYREKTSVRGILGAAMAVTGVAILFLI